VERDTILIPITVLKYFTPRERIDPMYVQVRSSQNVDRVAMRVQEILEARHRPGARYHVDTLTAILNAVKNISLILSAVLVLVSAITLVISGIGIMNIMLVTVTERTREIGIRKAIGAARREILYQFLVESFLISGGGAVVGILIGIAIPVVAQSFLPGNLRVPVSSMSVVLAFVVSCSTGLFFGYLPANQAASLQPVESLRYE
jgi:putative ABC transport system permease protein